MSVGDADELAARAAVIAADVDSEVLLELLPAIRGAADARQARRTVDRMTSGRVASQLLALFESTDYRSTVVALDAAAQTAHAVRRALGRTSVVWTGPTVRALPVRPTRQVVQQLIARSRQSLTIVTYASYGVQDLVAALNEARLERGVTVRLILETEEDSGGRLRGDAASALGVLARAVPVYCWPLANRATAGAAMHVKALIMDSSAILVSSANLTSAAMDRNMELGLLVEGGHVAETVERHLDELIDAQQIVRVGAAR
jgi:phosphatidylserine/phosphatidylglycerophosphate/cardiolipin synthase-like enzyme